MFAYLVMTTGSRKAITVDRAKHIQAALAGTIEVSPEQRSWLLGVSKVVITAPLTTHPPQPISRLNEWDNQKADL